MYKWLAGLTCIVLGIAGIAGCGDNSRDCGPGTVEENGHCLPAATCGFGTQKDEMSGQCVPDGSVVCSSGTVFDPLTGSCKLDPSACQNGTVLIHGACVDPTGTLVIDAQEGPEPNGLGIIEASDAQAGNVTIKPPGGEAYVIHGTLNPYRDLDGDGAMDPDVDTYVLQVTMPTYLTITSDGVGGAAGGFVVRADGAAQDPLAGWERVGLSLVSDTSKRKVLLPRAGRYLLAVADTRTLLEYVSGGPVTAAPGSATSEYYVSLTQEQAPPATALPLTNGIASVTAPLASDQLAVYSVQLGNGLNNISLAMPSELATASVTVLTNGTFTVTAQEQTGPARTRVGAVTPGDETLIVVEQASTQIPSATTYTLDVNAASATPLPLTGGSASTPATTYVGSDFTRLNLWSFDVSAANATLGFDLAWNQPVVGEIYDETGNLAASFTSPTTTVTWQSYRGLVRFAAAGHYYLAVSAPGAASTPTLSATATLTELTPGVLTAGTPLTVPMNTFRAVPLAYVAGSTAWQQFDVTGVNTGGQVASWFDPTVAHGRLDALVTSVGTLPSEVPPVFSHVFGTAGGAFGHVMLSDGTAAYYVKVNATNPSANATATINAGPRAAAVDLGALASGTTTTRTGDTLDAATSQRYYLFRAPAGKTVTLTVTPTSNLNTQFRRLAADESALGALINTSSNGADVESYVQGAEGWTAFVVSSAGNLSGTRTFDVSVQIQ